MSINSRLWFVLGSAFLISCQTLHREPAGVFLNDVPPTLRDMYNVQLNLVQQQELLKRAERSQNQEQEEKLSKSVRSLTAEKFKLEAQSQGYAEKTAHGDKPRLFEGRMDHPWGVKSEEVTLGDLDGYVKGRGAVRFFSMAHTGVENYELILRHETFRKQGPPFSGDREDNDNAQKYLEARMRCDAPFSLKSGLFTTDSFKAGETASFRWYDGSLNGQKVRFRPTAQVHHCEITFTNPWENNSREYVFHLRSEKDLLPASLRLTDAYEACVLPADVGLTKPQQFFLNSNYIYMNCPLETNSVTTLQEPEDGLQAKVEMLLGQKLPQRLIKEKNPFLPLDYSKAPKLDVIFVSYLVYRSDFYGNVLSRLLKYHADRGAQVRVLISDVITLKKDREMFEQMAAENGNIKVVYYRYDNDAQSGGKFHELHRTNHVKIFLTLSTSQPEANRVVIGGRNIHDGFLFRSAPDYSKHPTLVNYAKGEESFVHWRDFEILIRSKTFTEKVARQFYALWMQDSDTFNVRPTTVQAASAARPDPQYFDSADQHPLIRHYVSIPYKDEQTLEDYYAELIRHAQKQILISTPYFRPLKKVGAALKEAAERGVKITLITRLDLKGDTADFILGAVNKDGVNKFKDSLQIYEYTEPKIILHSKLIMIDDELSFIGSVNLNKRSFIHDMENGTLIYSPAFARKMASIYQNYLRQSRPITEKQRVHFWQRLVIGMFDSEF